MKLIQISLITFCAYLFNELIVDLECEYLDIGDVEYHSERVDQIIMKKKNEDKITENSSTKKLGEWKIVFYTGDAVWAGTDSDIYIELIGDYGNSKVTVLRPSKNQMEAKSVDSFYLGNLNGIEIGNLKQIVVGKQYTYSFFNDWLLEKIEVFDPQAKKYLFKCNCWFTSNKYKRLISLTSIETNNLSELSRISAKSSRVFPMTVALLFLFFILVSFTYFGKIMCNKWRDSLIYFSTLGSNDPTRNRRNRNNDDEITSRLMNLTHRNRSTTNNTNLENINPNLSRNQSNIIEDKPPDYMELFPYPTNSYTSHNKQEDQPPQVVLLPSSEISDRSLTISSSQAQPNLNQINVSSQPPVSQSVSSSTGIQSQDQHQNNQNQTSV